MKSFLRILIRNWLIPLTASALCCFHFGLWLYYLWEDSKHSTMIEGRLTDLLAFLHFILALSAMLYAAGLILIRNAAGRIACLASGLISVAIYAWWYYEKSRLMEPAGTPEYYEQLREFGLFRGGAGNLEYWALFLTLLLLVYAFLALSYRLIRNKTI